MKKTLKAMGFMIFYLFKILKRDILVLGFKKHPNIPIK